MELYTLDSLLRRTQVIDKFESLIWTERFADIGDFELTISSSFATRSMLTPGMRLAMNRSYRVMTVETVEDKYNADGKKILSVKGRSLESILEDRVAKDTMGDLTVDPKWVLTGTPGDVARHMFTDICVTGTLSLSDVIPFIMPGTIFPTDTVPEPETPITWEQGLASLYDAIKAVCDMYDLGFRLVRNFDTSQLYFNVYSGNDHTSRQDVLPPVVFSPDLDNLQNTTELTSIQKSKNVAYVFSEFGTLELYADNVDPDIEGFERRVLVVEASGIDADTVDVPAALEQAGREALSQNRAYTALDGEINEYSTYRYGIDYELGDLVEIRDDDGVVSYKRVTEQIFVHDQEGERSYPTLSMSLFTGQITWLSQTDIVWEDFTTEEWVDM